MPPIPHRLIGGAADQRPEGARRIHRGVVKAEGGRNAVWLDSVDQEAPTHRHVRRPEGPRHHDDRSGGHVRGSIQRGDDKHGP